MKANEELVNSLKILMKSLDFPKRTGGERPLVEKLLGINRQYTWTLKKDNLEIVYTEIKQTPPSNQYPHKIEISYKKEIVYLAKISRDEETVKATVAKKNISWLEEVTELLESYSC